MELGEVISSHKDFRKAFQKDLKMLPLYICKIECAYVLVNI